MECIVQKIEQEFLIIDGKKIKLTRLQQDWTLTKLAEVSGVTRKTLSEIEKGKKKRVRYSTLELIAGAFERQVQHFTQRE